MNQLWLNKSGHSTCILFFNGWGMDENAVLHLDQNGFDVCVYNDYRHIAPIENLENAYQKVVLIAWSLGVWAASEAISMSNTTIHSHIAINGTPCPVNDTYGIPERIFRRTLEGWNDKNRTIFEQRIMDGAPDTQRLSKRPTDNQKEELNALYAACRKKTLDNLSWDTAIIGLNDWIFPPQNQINWWTSKTKVVTTNQPHFPFNGLQNWKQLIEI